MKKYQILLVFIVSFSFGFSQDFSKNLTSFKSDSKTNQKEYSFTYKLPTDGYHFQISLDSTVVPVAIYIKYGDQEYFSGFIGQNSHSSFTQNDLTVAEKEKLLKIQPPQLKSTTETRIKSSKPDPLKISGGVEGEKYIIKDVNGTEIAVFKKIGSNLFDFRSKSNVPLIDDYSKENEIIFRKEYVKYVYKELNIDPSVQSLVITQGKERDRVDNGSCVLIDKPSDFYLEYFSELNALPRNFIGELIVLNQEYKLLKEINTSISRVSGKEISILFKNGDELASKNTEKIANGEISYLDGLKNYKNTIESQNKFSFEKKEGIDEITILVFSPLEKSSFTIQLSQSPEGLNQVYYLSGQLKEKYTLIGGKLNGEKISYYEDKNYKIGQDSKPIKEITTYSNGSMTGIHRQYDMSQNLILEEDLKDGVRNGMFKKYSGTKIIEQGNYLNNEKEGEWITQNYGEKITQNYTNGKLNGSFKKYEGDILRESGQYLDGLKNGEWKKFDSYGKVLELQNYKADKLDGIYKKYSGDIVIEEGAYSNGSMNGEWVYRYNDGQVHAQGKFINGNSIELTKVQVGKEELQSSIPTIPKSGREGLWKFYFSNGKLIEQSTWKNGMLDGDFIGYEYDDGFWRTKGKMSLGKLIGLWEFRFNYSSGVVNLSQQFVESDLATNPYNESDRADYLNEANKSIAENIGGFISYQVTRDWLKNALEIREDPNTRKLYEEYSNKFNESYNSVKTRINNSSQDNNISDDNLKTYQCKGYISQYEYSSSGKLQIKVSSVKCGACGTALNYGNGWFTFEGKKDDCNQKEYVCKGGIGYDGCGVKNILLPCNLKVYSKGENF